MPISKIFMNDKNDLIFKSMVPDYLYNTHLKNCPELEKIKAIEDVYKENINILYPQSSSKSDKSMKNINEMNHQELIEFTKIIDQIYNSLDTKELSNSFHQS